ncbi:3-phenylpropionate dioxygenase [Burkholderia sp. MSh2]|nr:3-phenylpropionate dioxygenase [Burkholderia sp. MSh2]
MYLEAELLDDRREREWLETMVSPDVVYQVPLRSTVERARGFGFSATTFHMDESYGSLMARVRRNESGFAWAEDPPSRARHFVSNIRVGRHDDHTLNVRSNLLLFRTRQEQTTPQFMSGERHDQLRLVGGQWMLTKRIVRLDLTAIASHNLAIFF